MIVGGDVFGYGCSDHATDRRGVYFFALKLVANQRRFPIHLGNAGGGYFNITHGFATKAVFCTSFNQEIFDLSCIVFGVIKLVHQFHRGRVFEAAEAFDKPAIREPVELVNNVGRVFVVKLFQFVGGGGFRRLGLFTTRYKGAKAEQGNDGEEDRQGADEEVFRCGHIDSPLVEKF